MDHPTIIIDRDDAGRYVIRNITLDPVSPVVVDSLDEIPGVLAPWFNIAGSEE